jgi:hypothetical protein
MYRTTSSTILFIAASLLLLWPSAARSAPLDPNAFTSLGTLNVTSGTIYINTNAGTMSGAVNYTGVFQSQLSAQPIAVFDFGSISISSGVTVSIFGTHPLALLSRGDANLGATLSVNANGTVCGSGGFLGAFNSTAGQGPGGGGFYNFRPRRWVWWRWWWV